jgi:hypothetical protein
MGFFRALAQAVYNEYDRRIKRASEIKEYGLAHHHDHDHVDEAEEEAEIEIVNVPRGTQLTTSTAEPPASSE